MEKRFDFCAIINARSGGCGEDCKWCAQSGRWRTGCERHGWVGTEACVRAAKDAGIEWRVLENDDPVPDGLSDVARSIKWLNANAR